MGFEQHKEDERKAKARAARDRAKQRKYTPTTAEYRGYVTYERSEAIKRQYEAWANEFDDIDDAMATALTLGFKYTVVAQDDGATVKASFYSTDTTRSDAGLGISAFADTYSEASSRALFFLAVCGGYDLCAPFFTLPDAPKAKEFWR